MTKQILFRPFALEKWLIIGFAAWLAHIGGGGFNIRGFNSRGTSDVKGIPAVHHFHDMVAQIPGWAIGLAVSIFVIVVIGLVILFTWLRARGRFIFTDCVVRNRAAIVEPWRDFRRLGNSFFLFSLLVTCGLLLLMAVMSLPAIVLAVNGRGLNSHRALVLMTIIIGVVVIVIVGIGVAVIMHLMVPIMYRRRCLAREAFSVGIGLIWNYPGEITVYILFWILLTIGVACVACLAACFTCCLALLPYVGTVILLPVYVCLRAFGLLFLRQFGRDYDVWAELPPPPLPPPPTPPAPAPVPSR